jgi:hypothetical protein
VKCNPGKPVCRNAIQYLIFVGGDSRAAIVRLVIDSYRLAVNAVIYEFSATVSRFKYTRIQLAYTAKTFSL